MATITLLNPKVTKAGTVHFLVSFDYAVQPLTAADFGLLTGGISGATITSAVADGTGSNYTVTVTTGSGSGTLGLAVRGAPALQQTTIGSAGSGAVAKILDINGDGLNDIATVGGATGTIQVMLDNGNGTYTTSNVGTAGSGAQVYAADINGDGRQDIVTIGGSNGDIQVIERSASGTYTTIPVGIGDLAAQLNFVDVNADGRLDILAAGRDSGQLHSFLQQSNGTFAQEGGSPFAVQGGARFGIVDFNGDTRPDLAISGDSPGTVKVLLRSAGGGFVQEGSAYPIGGGFGADIAVGDINGDLKADIVVVTLGGDVIPLFRNASNTGFTAGLSLGSTGSQSQIKITDLTGDGLPDVVVTGVTGSGNVTLFRATGAGAFATGAVIGSVGANPSYQTADVNGDGRLDYVATGGPSGDTKVLLNNGNNTFTSTTVGSAGGSVPSIDVGDLNGDGLLDLVTGGGSGGAIKQLVNLLGGPYEVDRIAPHLYLEQKSGTSLAQKTFTGIVTDAHAPGSHVKIFDNHVLVGTATVGDTLKTVAGVAGYGWTVKVSLANTANPHVLTFSATDVADNASVVKSLTFKLTGPVVRNGTSAADSLHGGTGNDTLKGHGGNDKLFADKGNDTLYGGNGNDYILGAKGRDVMSGGLGSDRFDYNSVLETGKTSTTRDRITDFTHRTDDIDLKTIDANGSASGNGTFKFVAKEGAAFSGVRGQLIWDRQDHSGTSKDVTIVSGDVNGDGKADFQIELTGLKTLTAGDFIL